LSHTLRFRRELIDDLVAAEGWYRRTSTSASSRFLAEVERTLTRIAAAPELYAAGARGVRSVRLRRFPYVLRYRITGQTIVLIALQFGGREPGSWQSRI
jgi:plasmid stabilization system protein ParE